MQKLPCLLFIKAILQYAAYADDMLLMLPANVSHNQLEGGTVGTASASFSYDFNTALVMD